MTDNEVINKLKRAADEITNTVGVSHIRILADDFFETLNLINRQQAEIERLQKAGEEAVSCFTRMESLYKIKCKELEIAKAEAVKEFAERLKQRTHLRADYEKITNQFMEVFHRVIDNLVKEMTEVQENRTV